MDKNSKTKIKKGTGSYLKYSSVAYKMAGTILIAVYIGQKLDTYYDNEKAYWTAGLSLLGVLLSFVSLYYTLKADDEAN